MVQLQASDQPVAAAPRRPSAWRGEAASALRSALFALRHALANDGIRRLGVSWTLGVAADSALIVVTLVTAFNRGGLVAAGLLGALRMLPAVLAGMFAGTMLERFRGDRILVALGLLRALSAAGIAFAIATAGASMADHQVTMVLLFLFSGLAAAASAPVRPTQTTLMPAIARSPGELVAANTLWTTGEGLGAFGGPFVAGLLMAANFHAGVAALAGVTFVVTALVGAGLRFEQAADASAGGRRTTGRIRLVDGLRAIAGRPVIAWTVFGTYAQAMTRGLLNAMIVVAAINLLSMGQGGLGLLGAALGLGGLVGAGFALTSRRSDRLVRTEILGLVFWGLPIVAIGIVPLAAVALFAMIVIGVSNATYDVALFTILQRGSTNDERGPVMSVLEAVIGLGAVSGSLLGPVLLLVFGERGGLIAGGAILPLLAAVMFWRVGKSERITVVNEHLIELLREVPAFAELPMTAVERLAEGLVPLAAPAGDVLMTQGESGDTFVVIESGVIEVTVDGRPIHRLGRGAGVGEIALLRRSPRTATVTAITDVTGYSVDASTFLAAVAGPSAAAVTERMAQANLQRAAATD